METEKTVQELAQTLQDQGFETMCVCLPTYNVGGGTFQLCQVLLYLAENTGLNVYYYDFEGGYPTKVLEGSRVTVLPYRTEDIWFPLNQKCLIITNSTRVIQLKKMNPENRLLFWHYETVPCAWEILFLLNETQDFFKLCNQNHAMVFHDWSGWDTLNEQYTGGDFSKTYFPLFLPRKDHSQTNLELVNENQINIAWLGRLGHEKIYSLYTVIENLADYETDKEKRLHIIGDGFLRTNVEAFCQKYANTIEFSFYGTMPKDKVNQFLSTKVDVLFAMGLSVVEGAALALPSVVVQLDDKPFHDKEYFWFHHSEEYCAGILPSEKIRYHVTYSKFRDIMDDLYVYGMKRELGELCYRHFMDEHPDVEGATCMFLQALADSTLTMEKLEKCIKYVPYDHVKVKRCTFLGRQLAPRIVER